MLCRKWFDRLKGAVAFAAVLVLSSTVSADIIYNGSTGRFIKLENNSNFNQYLQFDELEAFAPGYVPPAGLDNSVNNLARPAQGGSYEIHSGPIAHPGVGGLSNPINNVFDAGFNTLNFDNTAARNSWTLDLGTNRSIGNVRVWQRGAPLCCQDRLQNISVTLQADNGAGLPGAVVSTRTFNGQVPDLSQTTFNLSDARVIRPGGPGAIGNQTQDGATGRFIQIVKTAGPQPILHIGEIEAFLAGDPAAGVWATGPTNNVATWSAGARFYSETFTNIGGGATHGSNTSPFNGILDGGANTYSRENFVQYTLDLGSSRNLSELRIWQRSDGCCQDRLQNFTVNVLADNAGVPGSTVFSQNFAGPVATNSFQSFATNAGFFNIRGGDTLLVDINPAANTADKLLIGPGGLGTLTLEPGSILTLNFLNSSVKAGQTFDILDFGTDIGTFSSINAIGLAPGLTVDASRLYLNGTLSIMPEPGTVAIWSLLGLAAIPAARRLTRKKK